MGKLAFHKKSEKNYIQYTFRIEENILENIKEIAHKEDLSINEVLNQSLKYAVEDYQKNK